jgi:hypothetical protein
MPEAKRLEEGILPLIDKATIRRRGCVVRVYGETADVLWKQGREAAALRLETLGNELAQTRNVSILCGYSMHNSYKDGSFESICRQHTHVLSASGIAAPIGPGGIV